MHEKDTANETKLEPPQTYMMEFFLKKQLKATSS